MVRVILSSAIAIHAIIHILGAVKAWGLALPGQLNGKKLFEIAPRAAGLLWLVVCITLLSAAIVLLIRKEWYWVPAALGVALSQFLIIIYWQDAKWGTALNIVLGIIIVLAAASHLFNSNARKEAASLISNANAENIFISPDMTGELPPIIQRWITNSQMIGKDFGAVVRIKQTGQMRMDKGSSWIPFDAEQTVTFDPPAFVWNARIHSFVEIAGRDKFENGRGNMLIKAASIIPITNAVGREIDQGSMVRFMAELIWYPQAVFSDYLDWQQIDDHHVRATMHYGDITASGVYRFNDDGFPIGFEADRYRELNGKFSLETWSVSITKYKYYNGVPIGAHSEVTWRMKDGDFTWLKLDIQDITYDEK